MRRERVCIRSDAFNLQLMQLLRNQTFTAPARDRNWLLCANGGRGRIRTSVARKERQIYSLLVLATHPPVRTGNCASERAY